MGALVEGLDGSFYGVTQNGGAFGLGTVIRWTLPDQLSVLHSFTGGSDGTSPRAGLTVGIDGALYGTTALGGACLSAPAGEGGTLFRITTAGALTTLYAFGCAGDTRGTPVGGVTLMPDGSLVGTTYHGGGGAAGTVYRFTPSGRLSVVHDFAGNLDTGHP